MRKWKCTVCGYIAERDSLPDDFHCPLCGAPRDMFVLLDEGGDAKKDSPAAPAPAPATIDTPGASPSAQTIAAAPAATVVAAASSTSETAEDEPVSAVADFSDEMLSAVFLNLARGCTKQLLADESDAFKRLGAYYLSKADAQTGKDLTDVKPLMESDLANGFATARTAAEAHHDRGALRVLTWSEKVTRLNESLLERYATEGDAMLDGTKVFVCDICGFISLSTEPPTVCPICKVPHFAFIEIEGGN